MFMLIIHALQSLERVIRMRLIQEGAISTDRHLAGMTIVVELGAMCFALFLGRWRILTQSRYSLSKLSHEAGLNKLALQKLVSAMRAFRFEVLDPLFDANAT